MFNTDTCLAPEAEDQHQAQHPLPSPWAVGDCAECRQLLPGAIHHLILLVRLYDSYCPPNVRIPREVVLLLPLT